MSALPPACTVCGRTHTAAGNPVRLKLKGQHKGLCQSCMKRFVWDKAESIDRRAVDDLKRSLNGYLNARRERLARHQRHAKHPTVA